MGQSQGLTGKTKDSGVQACAIVLHCGCKTEAMWLALLPKTQMWDWGSCPTGNALSIFSLRSRRQPKSQNWEWCFAFPTQSDATPQISHGDSLPKP